MMYTVPMKVGFRYTITERYFYFFQKRFIKFFCEAILSRGFIIRHTFQSIWKFRFSYRTITSLRRFFRKNGKIYLTKIGIYIFFLKFRFFSKETFVKAFKLLINFMFIVISFSPQRRVRT